MFGAVRTLMTPIAVTNVTTSVQQWVQAVDAALITALVSLDPMRRARLQGALLEMEVVVCVSKE